MQYKSNDQIEKLLSLYQHKYTQAIRAKHITNPLMYMVLKAEADAIKTELDHQIHDA